MSNGRAVQLHGCDALSHVHAFVIAFPFAIGAAKRLPFVHLSSQLLFVNVAVFGSFLHVHRRGRTRVFLIGCAAF